MKSVLIFDDKFPLLLTQIHLKISRSIQTNILVYGVDWLERILFENSTVEMREKNKTSAFLQSESVAFAVILIETISVY